MKNKQDFLREVIAAIQKNISEMGKLDSMIEYKQKKIDSGMFDERYLEKTLYPEMKRLKEELSGQKDAAVACVRSLCDDYINELRAKEVLKPSELNDDILLLQTGIKLDSADLAVLLERNANNPTMAQLLFKYAKQNGIDVGNMTFTGHQPVIDSVEALAKTAETVIKWHDRPNVFEQLLGEGSEIEYMFRGDE